MHALHIKTIKKFEAKFKHILLGVNLIFVSLTVVPYIYGLGMSSNIIICFLYFFHVSIITTSTFWCWALLVFKWFQFLNFYVQMMVIRNFVYSLTFIFLNLLLLLCVLSLAMIQTYRNIEKFDFSSTGRTLYNNRGIRWRCEDVDCECMCVSLSVLCLCDDVCVCVSLPMSLSVMVDWLNCNSNELQRSYLRFIELVIRDPWITSEYG